MFHNPLETVGVLRFSIAVNPFPFNIAIFLELDNFVAGFPVNFVASNNN